MNGWMTLYFRPEHLLARNGNKSLRKRSVIGKSHSCIVTCPSGGLVYVMVYPRCSNDNKKSALNLSISKVNNCNGSEQIKLCSNPSKHNDSLKRKKNSKRSSLQDTGELIHYFENW